MPFDSDKVKRMIDLSIVHEVFQYSLANGYNRSVGILRRLLTFGQFLNNLANSFSPLAMESEVQQIRFFTSHESLTAFTQYQLGRFCIQECQESVKSFSSLNPAFSEPSPKAS